MRVVHKFSVLVALTLIYTLLPNTTGFAHSTLEQTFPSEGDQLTESPNTIEFWFQDPVVLHHESIQLKDNSGKQIELEQTMVEAEDKTHIISRLTKNLPPGRYVARVSVIALDGFVINEDISFMVVKPESVQIDDNLKILNHSPRDGEIVIDSPQKLDLWFNQPSEITAIGVFDDNQQSIRTTEPFVDPEDPNHLVVEFNEELPKGTYQVTWYARPINVDEQNQPDILDVYYFAVDQFTPIIQPNLEESTSSFWFESMGLKQVGYWLLFMGVSILFGDAFFRTIIRKKHNFENRKKLSLAVLLLVMIGVALILRDQKNELESLSFTQFLSLKFVWIPLLQVGMLTIGIFLNNAKIFFFGIPLLLLPLITGHAAYPRYGGYLSIMISAVHLVAASIWIGGLFGIITIPRKENMKEFIQSTLLVISKWALISLLVIIGTGLYMANQYVPSFSIDSYLKSEWGKAIAIKIGLTLVIVIIGFYQRRAISKLTIENVAKIVNTVRVEIVYAVLILLFASILVVSTPGAAERGIYPSSVEKENVHLRVDFSPLNPGLNVLTMNFGDEEIKEVEVTLSMPPNYQVNYNAFKLKDGVFKLTGNLLHAAGTMDMKVDATKTNGEKIEFPFRIVVPGEMRFNE